MCCTGALRRPRSPPLPWLRGLLRPCIARVHRAPATESIVTRPPDPRIDPPLSMPTYAVRAPLARWLTQEAARAAADFGRYRLLDAGCGEKPYAALFAPYISEHVGLDNAAHADADIVGPIEAIPAEDASFDLVTCIQVLEHVDDPAQAVRELHRVTRPEIGRASCRERRKTWGA